MEDDNMTKQFVFLYRRGTALYSDGKYAAARPCLVQAAQLALKLSEDASSAKIADIYLGYAKEINDKLEKIYETFQRTGANPRTKFHARMRISAHDIMMILIFNILPLSFIIAQIVIISVARESAVGQIISGISALIAIVLSGWGCFSEIFEDFAPVIKGLVLPRIVALVIGILSIVLVLGQYFSTCQS